MNVYVQVNDSSADSSFVMLLHSSGSGFRDSRIMVKVVSRMSRLSQPHSRVDFT